MAQTKFDKQVEETAESLMFGIGRFPAGRPMDGVKRTDATFWRSVPVSEPPDSGAITFGSAHFGDQYSVFCRYSVTNTGSNCGTRVRTVFLSSPPPLASRRSTHAPRSAVSSAATARSGM
ncbi:hypothetical protein [Streptomyces sp. NPDC002553]|uniref:hypothetical protein n=1 Tax=Streptomyces sp. NPDC002553 TaxID=3154417 RepID=UPI003318E079